MLTMLVSREQAADSRYVDTLFQVVRTLYEHFITIPQISNLVLNSIKYSRTSNKGNYERQILSRLQPIEPDNDYVENIPY